MKKYTIKPNRHDFRPPEFPHLYCARKIRELRWEFRFTRDCAYTLPGEDQHDWNKGGGISFHLLRNNRDSLMWAWRYDPCKELIEITAYSNNPDELNGRFIGWGAGQTMMNLQLDEVGECILTPYDHDHWRFTFRRNYQPITNSCLHPVRRRWRLAKRLGLWFGGNRPAPKEMTIYVGLEKS